MEWSLMTLYVGSAVVGGLVLLFQLALLFLGGDADVDADADFDVHAGDAGEGGLNLLSVRAVAGFLTFFGLAGAWGTQAQWGTPITLVVATALGSTMMVLVAWMLTSLKKLSSSGNVDPKNAVGATAQVYLRIPAHHSGQGKITVSIQGRSMQYAATTAGAELPTGSTVRVERMTTDGTFEVAPLA
jgi:hypothetical protein